MHGKNVQVSERVAKPPGVPQSLMGTRGTELTDLPTLVRERGPAAEACSWPGHHISLTLPDSFFLRW